MTAAIRTDPSTTVDVLAPRTRRRPSRPTVLVGGAVLTAVALPFIVDAYTISIASTALVLATLAISTQLLTGVAGLPSLGQAAYLGVGAYTAALIGIAGLSSGPAQLAAAALAAAAAAAVCAPLVLRTRGIAFLMVTFAVAELARTLAGKWASLTGGDEGLPAPPVTAWPGGPPLSAAGYAYLYLLGCFLVLAALIALLLRTRTALALHAAADHEPRLGALGHHVTRTLLAGYVTAGAVAGAAGAMLVAAHRYLSPADMNLDASALALLAASIGGRSMRGAVAGAVLVVAVRDLAGAETGGHALALLGLAFLVVAYQRPVAAHLYARMSRGRR